jgi:hypothetical protein
MKHVANAACCMTPVLLASNAAGCVPHTQIYFYETTKIITGINMPLESLD